MLELNELISQRGTSLKRGDPLRDKLKTVGPRIRNKAMLYVPYYWRGEVVGDKEAEGWRNAALQYISPTGLTVVFNRFTSPDLRTRFDMCFDSSGRENVCWQEGDTSYLHFRDDNLAQWVDLDLGTGARSPTVALDSLNPTNPMRDVVVSYLRGTKLYVRYQRERFATEHAVPGVIVQPDNMLRVSGQNSDYRFSWRFENKLPAEMLRR